AGWSLVSRHVRLCYRTNQLRQTLRPLATSSSSSSLFLFVVVSRVLKRTDLYLGAEQTSTTARGIIIDQKDRLRDINIWIDSCTHPLQFCNRFPAKEGKHRKVQRGDS